MLIIKSLEKNKKVFLVTVLQVTLLLMLVAITVKGVLGEMIFYLIEGVLSFVFLKVLFFDLGKELKKEHKYSVYFFGPLYLIIQLSWIAQFFLTGTANLFYFLGFIFVIFLFVAFFRVIFGRNYVEGKVVLSNKKIAVVQTDFDIRSFSTAEKHIVQTNKKIREGKKVKIALKRSIFGKKTAKII